MVASCHREKGDYEKADHLLKDAYLKVAVQYGEENVSAAAILNSQGMLYKKWGKFERSLDSYERSLNVKEKFFGEEHPESCSTRHNIGELFV